MHLPYAYSSGPHKVSHNHRSHPTQSEFGVSPACTQVAGAWEPRGLTASVMHVVATTVAVAMSHHLASPQLTLDQQACPSPAAHHAAAIKKHITQCLCRAVRRTISQCNGSGTGGGARSCPSQVPFAAKNEYSYPPCGTCGPPRQRLLGASPGPPTDRRA